MSKPKRVQRKWRRVRRRNIGKSKDGNTFPKYNPMVQNSLVQLIVTEFEPASM